MTNSSSPAEEMIDSVGVEGSFHYKTLPWARSEGFPNDLHKGSYNFLYSMHHGVRVLVAVPKYMNRDISIVHPSGNAEIINTNSLLHNTILSNKDHDSPKNTDSALRGGMNFGGPQPPQHAALQVSGSRPYKGLQLTNPRNDCYLNTAVNNVITNDTFRKEIMNPDMTTKWIINALRTHQPDYNDEIESFSVNEVLSRWDDFVSSMGCSEHHGPDCFENLRYDYHQMTSRAPVVQELRVLINATLSVQNVRTLKNQMALCYPTEQMYFDDFQHGAGEAFTHLLSAVPTLQKEYKQVAP